MKNGDKPIANPHVVLREEFDDWAVLFNPDAGLGFAGFGLNPTGVYLWKLLDGEHTIDALLKEITHLAEGVPEAASDHIGAFIDALVAEGLAGFDRSRFGLPDDAGRAEKCSSPPPAPLSEMKPFTYDPPKLINLNSRADAAHGNNCSGHGSGATGLCSSGHVACSCSSGTSTTYTFCCNPSGSCASYTDPCCNGTCVDPPINSCCPGSCNSPSSDCFGGCGPMYYCDCGSSAGYTCNHGNIDNPSGC